MVIACRHFSVLINIRFNWFRPETASPTGFPQINWSGNGALLFRHLLGHLCVAHDRNLQTSGATH